MRVILTLLWLGSSGLTAHGNPDLHAKVEAETLRREQAVAPLQKVLQQSEQFATQGETLRAWETLSQAWQSSDPSIRNSSAGLQVQKVLGLWESELAAMEARQAKWPSAREWALRSLQREPENTAAKKILEEANTILSRGAVPGEAINPALSDLFFEKLQKVRDGLKEAEQLRETGQLEKAEARYESVLGLDPFNSVATEGIRKIFQERALVADQSRDLSNLERKREVREAWNNIYPKKSASTGGVQVTGPLTASPTFQLEQKLRNIRIPQVNFVQADLETVRKALKKLSEQYDTDGKKTGVNFLVSADITSSQPVNLSLRDVSLGEVVRYVAQIAGVKSRLSEVGVRFSPLVEIRPDLIPREFIVSPSFFRETGGSTEDSATATRRGGAAGQGEDVGGGEKSEQSKLEELGVKFPPGSFAVYNRNTTRLRVVNNAEMLDLIGQLIGAADEQTLLIQVGVRLIEINQADLDSVTFNSTLAGSPLSTIPAGLSTNNQGAIPYTGSGWNAQLNQIQGVGLLPNNTLQSFLQQGVLAGTNQPSNYALNTLQVGGTILNGMQFRALITAISQKSSANVLANPSIILKRGQEGSIEITQEFRYVQEYNDPQSSIRTFTPVATTGLGFGVVTTGVPGPETVISSFPSQISDPVPIGVKLGVKPDITGDNTRVLMDVKPSFVDFEGFINYGTGINSAYAAAYYDTQVAILTNNIQQPVFVRRDLSLPAVEVSDGHTLMLGGLLREDIQKIDEKVPIIGDIPLLGRAFQGKTEQAVKKNTLIFVTPRILQVDGQPLNPTAGAATTASAAVSP